MSAVPSIRQGCSLNILLSSRGERALTNTQPRYSTECLAGEGIGALQGVLGGEGVEENLGKNVSWKPKELQCLKGEMEVTCAIKSSDKA